MDEIKSWAFSVCTASICGAAMNIILPEGSTQKVFKSVFCVFFLCCVISPLLNMDFINGGDILNSFEAEYEEESGLENRLYESSAAAMEEDIKTKTASILDEAGVNFSNISIKINILEGGGIEINEFSVTAASEIPDGLKEKIGSETGLIPEVKIAGDDV